MPATGRRPLLAAAAAGLACALLGGCGFAGAQNLPLPGGASLGAHPYTVIAEFGNVLSLVPQSSVKVNDVDVGRVTRIGLAPDGWTAEVTMKINGGVRLPADAYARIAQSSLLGEKYVELSAPPKGGTGRLATGDTIPLAHTGRDVTAEEVLGATSLLLNGGGLAQFHTITVELNKALAGNEPAIRSALSEIATTVGSLDSHKQQIVDALDAVDRLSATLDSRNGQIGTALTDLSPGLKVLDQQRGALMTMLAQLNRLSGVAVDTIDRSKDDMVSELTDLQPVLRKLADAGESLPKSLQVLLTYPFTDAVTDAVKGDYLNAYLSVVAVPGTQVIAPLDPNAGSGGGGSPSASASAQAAPNTAAGSGTGARPGGGAGGSAGGSWGPGSGGSAGGSASPPLPLPSVSGSSTASATGSSGVGMPGTGTPTSGSTGAGPGNSGSGPTGTSAPSDASGSPTPAPPPSTPADSPSGGGN